MITVNSFKSHQIFSVCRAFLADHFDYKKVGTSAYNSGERVEILYKGFYEKMQILREYTKMISGAAERFQIR